jgi:hypothetical protein
MFIDGNRLRSPPALQGLDWRLTGTGLCPISGLYTVDRSSPGLAGGPGQVWIRQGVREGIRKQKGLGQV